MSGAQAEHEALLADRDAYMAALKSATDEIAALRADNAALLDFVSEQAQVDCDGAEQCGGVCGPCTAKALRDQPHPGAELLEEHRNTLARIEDVLAAASAYSDKPHHLYSAVRRLATVFRDGDERIAIAREMEAAYSHHDDHKKALGRARNEALEKAKVACTEVYKEHKRSGSYPMDMGGLAIECRDRIDALREPEQ